MSIKQVILRAIDTINETLPEDSQIGKEDVSPLYGAGSALDSLGLVTLIAEIEGLVFDETGHQLTLADERAMSQKSSPFLTVASLVSYTERLVLEAQGDA